MKLKLSEDWMIEAEDQYCFTVKHRNVIEDSDKLKDKSRIGEDYWVPISYHSDLQLARRSALNKGAIFSNEANDIFDLYVEFIDRTIEVKTVEAKPHKRVS